MKLIKKIFIFIFLLMNCWILEAHANQIHTEQAFLDLDHYFVKQYSEMARSIGKNTRPLLVVNGFNYQLYLKDGSTQTFQGLIAPFNELKSIAHLGPTLYTILLPFWQNPADVMWRQKLLEFQTKIIAAQQAVNAVSWENPLWPNEGAHLKNFMDDSLTMINRFINNVLRKNSVTLKEYQEFSSHFMHSMLAPMYLSNVLNTISTINQLKKWQQQLGEKEWENLYVAIIGSKGRTTAELTLDTNTAAITIASLLKPENVKSHILIMPMAHTLDEIEITLGEILLNFKLANDTFTTNRAKKATGVFKAMLTPDVPLARDNVKRITTNYILHDKINLPKIGLLPKDE